MSIRSPISPHRWSAPPTLPRSLCLIILKRVCGWGRGPQHDAGSAWPVSPSDSGHRADARIGGAAGGPAVVEVQNVGKGWGSGLILTRDG